MICHRSRRQVEPAEQVLKTRVGAQGIEDRFGFQHAQIPLVISGPVYKKVLVFDIFGAFLADTQVPLNAGDGAMHPYDGAPYLSHAKQELPILSPPVVTAVGTQSLQVLATAPIPAAEGPFALVVQ